MTKQHSLFLFAGEKSADLHGEKLVHALRAQNPRSRIYGVGGPKMRAAGLECILPMEKFEVMGFVDVFFALPRLMKQFFFLRNLILSEKPDILLTIDYPGFNLALAKSLKKRGFEGKLCHYICPSVWAWGKKRIPKMEKILDHLFVILPFEKELFNEKNLSTHYVGHPLIRHIHEASSPPLNISKDKTVIALFPGSREKELRRNFKEHLHVAKELHKLHANLLFVVSVASPSFSLLLDQIIKEERFPNKEKLMFLESRQNYALMKRADLAIAKSGTNNLELALHQVPTVVTYGVGPLDLFIARHVLRIRLRHYCIVNICANQTLFPELIGPNLTKENLYTHISHFLSSEGARQECREKCHQLGTILKQKSPEKEIAQILKNFLNEKK